MTHSLKQDDWIHFVAVGGTAMGALAGYFKENNYCVTGSDKALYSPMKEYLLNDKKVDVKIPFQKNNLIAKTWNIKNKTHPDVIIIGNAVSAHFEEALEAEKLRAEYNVKIYSFAEAVSEFLIQDKTCFVCSGTHGKSTTSSILSYSLEQLSQQPGFFVGAILANFRQSLRAAKGDYFAIEGDEYDTAYWDKGSKFLHYKPAWTICTGIEFDHADIFNDIDDILKTFQKLAHSTQKGLVLVDERSVPEDMVDVLKRYKNLLPDELKVVRYGKASDSDYQLLSYKYEQDKKAQKVKFSYQDKDYVYFLPMSGEHNILNSLAVVAALNEEGVASLEDILNSFQGYLGLKRRQEVLFEENNRVLIDDFAHHPTAIKETINAMKQKYPDFIIHAFFEARSATSSRNIFFEQYLNCFNQADKIYFSEPTKDNIPEEEKLETQELINQIKSNGLDIIGSSDVNELLLKFKKNLNSKKHLALIMSNGPFSGIHQKIKSIFEKETA